MVRRGCSPQSVLASSEEESESPRKANSLLCKSGFPRKKKQCPEANGVVCICDFHDWTFDANTRIKLHRKELPLPGSVYFNNLFLVIGKMQTWYLWNYREFDHTAATCWSGIPVSFSPRCGDGAKTICVRDCFRGRSGGEYPKYRALGCLILIVQVAWSHSSTEIRFCKLVFTFDFQTLLWGMIVCLKDTMLNLFNPRLKHWLEIEDNSVIFYLQLSRANNHHWVNKTKCIFKNTSSRDIYWNVQGPNIHVWKYLQFTLNTELREVGIWMKQTSHNLGMITRNHHTPLLILCMFETVHDTSR